ncbi:hypothetical protein JCM11251_001952 [Rhodosporidiobolus azoricus]
MDDPPLDASFVRAAEFSAGAYKLTHLDYEVEAEPESERGELQLLDELCGMLDEYQEQPHLLDPSLEKLISPLLIKLREQVRRPNPPLEGKRLNRLARLVYFVTKVRGSKVIVGFFPHETSDLSLLIPLLHACFCRPPSPDSSTSIAPPSPLSSASWELRYILLLWLSVAIRIPFDLRRLDQQAPDKVQALGFEALTRSSKEGDGAAGVLGRFYCRQDAPISNLLKACEDCFSGSENPNTITAYLTLLSLVLRNAPPSALLPHWSSLYRLLAYLPENISSGKSGAGMAKMRCKVAGRLALLRLAVGAGERGDGDGGRGEDEVPEEVEIIVGELIDGLGHPDTLPRYSSAKYLSRLCQALPRSFSSQILDAVLSTLEEALSEANEGGLAEQAEGKVQGACLALGEMARRGLIGKDGQEGSQGVIGGVFEGVLQALSFDHLYLSRSLGASCRDSAAYVLWSLSRTLPSSLARDYGAKIAERLVCTALFDREVQVRRAASAAFQECVGRWGIFAHGIDVLRRIDFFTVSVRHRAYHQAAPSVASHIEYRPSILSHLLQTGITHYDTDLRTLSAKALGAVVALDAEGSASGLINEQIKKLSKTKDAAKLHGVLLSLAALAESVSSVPCEEREGLRRDIFSSTLTTLLSPSPPYPRMLKSSPLVLSASLSALASSAPTPSDHPLPVRPEWFDLMIKACDTVDEGVHKRAGDTVKAISRARRTDVYPYYVMDTLLAELDQRSGTRQQAAALMLGKVVFSASVQDESGLVVRVVRRLVSFVQREGSGKAATIEARRNGVEALASLLHDYHASASFTSLLPSAFEALLLGFSDYTNDQRGDVGSWVRIATLNSWSALLSTLVRTTTAIKHDQVDQVVANMAKQAVERLDNVREVAGRALLRAWAEAGEKEGDTARLVWRKKEVWEGIAAEPRQSWRDLSWASERILPLLEVVEYRTALLEGAVLATSQYSASTPFLDYALSLPPLPSSPIDTSFNLLSLLTSLHSLARAHFSSNRLFVPLLHLLSSLAETGCLDEILLDESGAGAKEVAKLLNVATNAVARMKSPQRTGAAGKVVIAFLALPHVGLTAAEKVPLFLSHPLGWLRQQVADELFGQLPAIGLDGEEELLVLLTETSWISPGFEEAAGKVAEHLQAALGASQRQC